jgi:hypothetical protein
MVTRWTQAASFSSLRSTGKRSGDKAMAAAVATTAPEAKPSQAQDRCGERK